MRLNGLLAGTGVALKTTSVNHREVFCLAALLVTGSVWYDLRTANPNIFQIFRRNVNRNCPVHTTLFKGKRNWNNYRNRVYRSGRKENMKNQIPSRIEKLEKITFTSVLKPHYNAHSLNSLSSQLCPIDHIRSAFRLADRVTFSCRRSFTTYKSTKMLLSCNLALQNATSKLY